MSIAFAGLPYRSLKPASWRGKIGLGGQILLARPTLGRYGDDVPVLGARGLRPAASSSLHLLPDPPSSLELNPVEHLWDHLREN